MDLSKLPKLSESPAPAQPVAPLPAGEREPIRMSYFETGMDVLISLVVGSIFLMLGAPFGGWLIAKMNGQVYDTSITWLAGTPKAGQIVDLFEIQLGPGWLYMGHWVLGAALVIEALLMILAAVSVKLRKPLIVLALLLCVGGAVANIVAAVMQIKMGFNQPVLSMIAVLVAGVIAFFHGRHLTDSRGA